MIACAHWIFKSEILFIIQNMCADVRKDIFALKITDQLFFKTEYSAMKELRMTQ